MRQIPKFWKKMIAVLLEIFELKLTTNGCHFFGNTIDFLKSLKYIFKICKISQTFWRIVWDVFKKSQR